MSVLSKRLPHNDLTNCLFLGVTLHLKGVHNLFRVSILLCRHSKLESVKLLHIAQEFSRSELPLPLGCKRCSSSLFPELFKSIG